MFRFRKDRRAQIKARVPSHAQRQLADVEKYAEQRLEEFWLDPAQREECLLVILAAWARNRADAGNLAIAWSDMNTINKMGEKAAWAMDGTSRLAVVHTIIKELIAQRLILVKDTE